MPDPMRIVLAVAVAAALAAAVLLASGHPWRSPRSRCVRAGWVIGVGLGFFFGSWLLAGKPHWPPVEDQDRLFFVLLPALLLVELVAGWPRVPAWLAWTLRLLVAACAGRVLLHGTTYLSDFGGTITPTWSASQAWFILAGLAAALAANWWLLLWRQQRSSDRAVPLCLALVSAGAGVAIMFSGYATGGELGFPLAGALGGAAVASWLLSGPPDARGALSVALVCLFGLLMLGLFFGKLTITHAAILFITPQLCWVTAVPLLRRRRWGLCGLIPFLLVVLAVTLVVLQAQQQFDADSQSSSRTSEETGDDYSNYGK